jgi:hypothetical protein
LKVASAGYQSILAAENFLLADLYFIQLIDGSTAAYATFDRNIVYNGTTYLSTPPGLLERSDVTQKREATLPESLELSKVTADFERRADPRRPETSLSSLSASIPHVAST